MTYGAFTARDFTAYDLDRRYRTPFSQTVLCAFALTVSASAGLWALYTLPPSASPGKVEPVPVSHAASSAQSATHRVTLPAALAPLRRYAALLDPTLTVGQTPMTFAQSAPLRARFEPPHESVAAMSPASDLETEAPRTDAGTADVAIVPPLPDVSAVVQEEAIPLPTPRPALLASIQDTPALNAGSRRTAQHQALASTAAPATAQPTRPGFFERFFGGATSPSSSVLAYAAPEDGMRGGLFGTRAPVSDSQTAVYDISAHTVYLPDGTRLEAHSGLGANKDDPRSVGEHMRGATPPHVYELTPREAIFHGVRALRLTPVGDGTTYGRGGLLAHTFMLGPHGDSNGCVVFRNYKAFLDAYDAGQIRRLLVVARLG